MNDMPDNIKYATTHEWAKLEQDNLVHVGITDFAQDELGDLVFLELPEVGRQVKQGEKCAVIESVKTASDLHSPVTGIVHAINEDIVDELELINEAAFDHWLFAIKADNISELDQLMDNSAYSAMIEE